MAETSFVNRIAFHATPETTAPTAPAKGSNIASLSGWTVIGSIQAGHDADLDADGVEITFFDEKGEVMPPRSLTREEVLNFRNGVDTITFTAYDGSEALLALGSSLTPTTNITEAVQATTYRTMVVEVNGLWFDYFPRCEVTVTSVPAGYTGEPAKTVFTVRPTATSTIKGGWQRHHYQAA